MELIELRKDTSRGQLPTQPIGIHFAPEVVQRLDTVMQPLGWSGQAWLDKRSKEYASREWPWLMVLFPRNYPMAGHLAEVRCVKWNAPMDAYPTSETIPDHTAHGPYLGAFWVRTRGVMRKMAGQSQLIQQLWDRVATLSKRNAYIMLADELDRELLRDLEQDNAARYKVMQAFQSNYRYVPLVQVPAHISRLDLAASATCHCAGDMEGLYSCAQRLIRRYPDFPDAWMQVGIAAQALHRHREAVDALKRVLAVQTGCHEVWARIANSYALMNCCEEAIVHGQKALEIDPYSEASWRELCFMHLRSGNLPAALGVFSELQVLESHDEGLFTELGRALFSAGRHAEALMVFEALIGMHPEVGEYWNNAGYMLAFMGRLDESIRYCRVAVELNPNSHNFHDSMGFIHLVAGRATDSIPCFKHSLILEPGHVPALLHLACAWTQVGDLELARNAVTNIQPRDPQAAAFLQEYMAGQKTILQCPC